MCNSCVQTNTAKGMLCTEGSASSNGGRCTLSLPDGCSSTSRVLVLLHELLKECPLLVGLPVEAHGIECRH